MGPAGIPYVIAIGGDVSDWLRLGFNGATCGEVKFSHPRPEPAMS
jgi:hypothetical protein